MRFTLVAHYATGSERSELNEQETCSELVPNFADVTSNDTIEVQPHQYTPSRRSYLKMKFIDILAAQYFITEASEHAAFV